MNINIDYGTRVPIYEQIVLEVEKLDFCYKSGYKTTMTKADEINKLLVNI